MQGPRLSWAGRMLPARWQRSVLSHAHGLDAPALLAELFLSYPEDDYGLDPKRTKLTFYLLEKTICRYFRPEVWGAENVPPGRALIISCHSGVLPYDATCLVVAIYKHTGRISRNAGDHFFGRFGLVERFLAARGALVGYPERLEDLLQRDELVVLFPGGAEDMRRPFWERYRVRAHKGFAPGRGGYIKLALRTRSPIVPVAIVGAEETHFLVSEVPPLARLVGLPFFPIVLSPLPLPARFYIRFGRPIHLAEPAAAADDQQTVDRLNREVRAELQALIDDTRRHRRGIYWSSYDGAAP